MVLHGKKGGTGGTCVELLIRRSLTLWELVRIHGELVLEFLHRVVVLVEEDLHAPSDQSLVTQQTCHGRRGSR